MKLLTSITIGFTIGASKGGIHMANITKKVPVSFNPDFLKSIDLRWEQLGFKGRSDYINHLLRKDMEQHGQIQQPTVSE